MSEIKVNGEKIFAIVTHNQVLIEKTLKGLILPLEVPVYKDFNYQQLIGIAKLSFGLPRGSIYADISLFADIKGIPAIGFIQDTRKVYCVSINEMRNADPDIKALA